MLYVQCKEHMKKVRAFAEKVGKAEQLQKQLDYLASYACSEDNPNRTRCDLWEDFAPYSFRFMMMIRDEDKGGFTDWFNGGLIFHGAHDNGGDGGPPTYSVNLSPTDGWAVHT